MKTGKDGWTRKFKGNERGGAHIHIYPGLTRGIVVNHHGVFFDGAEFTNLESAKAHALSTLPPSPTTSSPEVERPDGGMKPDRLMAAAKALIADVRARYPGEELRCPLMIELDAAVVAGSAQ